MKIAVIAPRYAPDVGGVERHVAEIATRLAAGGSAVTVFTQSRSSNLASTEQLDGVLIRRFRDRSPHATYGLAPSLFAALARGDARDFDLVHAHGYHALPALAALAARTTVVLTPHYHGAGHTRLADLAHRPYRLAGGLLFRRARAVICVSAAEQALVNRDFRFATRKTSVIPNGVDIAAIRAAVPYPKSGTLIVVAGRLEAYKRVDRVLAAFAELDPSFRLVLLGAGGAAVDLARQIQALAIGDRVELRGFVDDCELHRTLRSAAVVVSLSEAEAYGLSLVEGLAAGAAVVASDIPAHREAVGGKSGVTLVSHTAASSVVADALRAAAELHTQGLSVADVPSWDDVAARTAELYREAIA